MDPKHWNAILSRIGPHDVKVNSPSDVDRVHFTPKS